MFSLPSLFVPTAAMPPSPPHPLWRFPVKCNLHVTMERQWGCPPPLTAPRGSWEGKATQRSVHVPEGHSDSSILCPAPVMLPAQKGTLYETWQDLSTGQEELALWLFFYSWGGWQKRRGTSVLLTPPSTHPAINAAAAPLWLQTKPLILSGQLTRPETTPQSAAETNRSSLF